MIQKLQSETINCPNCGEQHPSTLYGFPRHITYKATTLDSVEYYHSCPNNKVFFQTEQDVVQTFIAERAVKRNYDQMIIQQQNMNNQGWNIQFTNQ